MSGKRFPGEWIFHNMQLGKMKIASFSALSAAAGLLCFPRHHIVSIGAHDGYGAEEIRDDRCPPVGHLPPGKEMQIFRRRPVKPPSQGIILPTVTGAVKPRLIKTGNVLRLPRRDASQVSAYSDAYQ